MAGNMRVCPGGNIEISELPKSATWDRRCNLAVINKADFDPLGLRLIKEKAVFGGYLG